MVLKGNEREREPRVATEPELKGNVHGAAFHFVPIIGHSRIYHSFCSVVHITTLHHVPVTSPVTLGLGEFVPDLEPITVVLVDALTTDLHLDRLDELVAHICVVCTFS